MSVSMKSTKVQMYSEIERLRALLDQQQAQLAMQAESIRRMQEREAKSEERATCRVCDGGPGNNTRCSCPTEEREVTLSKIEIGKRLAVLMKRSVRNAQGGGFESYVDGAWVAVPQRVVRYACGGAA